MMFLGQEEVGSDELWHESRVLQDTERLVQPQRNRGQERCSSRKEGRDVQRGD